MTKKKKKGFSTQDFPVRIMSLRKAQLLHLMTWRNLPEIRIRTRQWRLLSMVDQGKWWESINGHKWPDNLMYIIEVKETVEKITSESSSEGSPEYEDIWVGVGVCGLCGIDYINRSAELSIYIGVEKYRGKGVGSKAVEELKIQAFDFMHLNKIWAEIFDFAHPVKCFVVKNKFQSFGKLPDSVWRFGEYHDGEIFAYFEKDWIKEKKVVFKSRKGENNELCLEK